MIVSTLVILVKFYTCTHITSTVDIVKTPTQPQLNLNLVGFDMIIILHPPHPHHHHHEELILPERLVLEVRNFVMQHRPAILTTPQHNFNPTIFWGRYQPLPHQG